MEIRQARHVLAVPDVERSARYFHEVLGFQIVEVGDSGWRFLVKNACFIMAGECRDAIPATELGDHSYVVYLEVDDVDAFYASVVEKGASITKRLRLEPWGMREFGLRTIDGHRIMFGSAMDGSAEA